MRRFLFPGLVVLACVPLLLAAVLFAAAQIPAMDRMTMAMPDGLRSSVGALAMGSVGEGKGAAAKIDRVLKFDPDNAAAWGRRCVSLHNPDPQVALTECRKALMLNRSEMNYNGMGQAQEDLQRYCAAEESYTRANRTVNARDEFVLRNLGRAALKCGHAGAAISSFEVAEEHDETDGHYEVKLDREWLVVAHHANHDPEGAAASCAKAHPGWKNCSCTVNGKELACVEMK